MSVLGIDEVGRGPWAGPLVIGACILPKDKNGDFPDWVKPLTDSKKLSLRKREELSKVILENALATGLGWVSSTEIDELGLSESLRLATRRAVEEVQKQKVPFSEIIIDGTQNFLKGTGLEKYVTNLKKADLLIKEVSAASIIAKVARDHYMVELAEKYPGYGFEKHVGYGTKLHSEMLAKFGPCPEHRQTFGPIIKASGEIVSFRRHCAGRCRPAPWDAAKAKADALGRDTREDGLARPVSANELSTISESKATTKELGDKAESIMANYLIRSGHSIVARNHKTKFYEIDIVSIKNDKIYFTEVKYRKSQYRGTSLDMITKKKLKQMTFAAECFLKYYEEYKEFSPLLSVGLVKGDDFEFDDWFIIK